MNGLVSRLAGLMLVLVIALSMMPIVALSEAKPSGVEVFIAEAKARLSEVLALIESIDPSLASRLRGVFEEAMAKVDEAKSRVGVDPEGALAEVLRAQVKALNATRSALVKVNVTYPPGLLVALDVKMSMVVELNETIQYLKSANVTIEEWVEVKLRDTALNIVKLKEGLITGALNTSQVAVRLGDVNRNISDVRVYLAKLRHEWVKVHVENHVARSITRILGEVRVLSGALMRGDPDAVSRLVANTTRLEELLARLPEVGLPGDLLERLKNITMCKIEIAGGQNVVPVGLIARILEKAGGDEVKTRLVVAELIRCLKQPLGELKVTSNVKVKAREVVAEVDRIEEEARRRTWEVLEKAPQASIGLIEVELRYLRELYESYKAGKTSKEEVRVQALLVLEIAGKAREFIGKLPKPAQEQLLQKVRIAEEEAKRILEELG